MATTNGIIALMGSGEMTSTMVEVHKELLGRYGGKGHAVFIDTPAGFQLNADHLSEKAVEYFRTRIMHPLTVVSYRSAETILPYEAEQAYQTLRQADYILIGPGSPTYAVRQWKTTPIPNIITSRIQDGACLVAASAAALTVGRYTLPVYEIYKVGEPLHWINGIDILGAFGLNVVVIPHWNNAEGGTHDTRYCYMGEPRFSVLLAQLPADTGVIGLDEHTACLIDLAGETFSVRGLGQMTYLRSGIKRCFAKGISYPLYLLGDRMTEASTVRSEPPLPEQAIESPYPDDRFWHKIHELHRTYQSALERGVLDHAVNALLSVDELIWKAQQELENPEYIVQSREILREMIVLLGTALRSAQEPATDLGITVVNCMVELRNSFRQQHKWEEADAIRECLAKAGVIIEDRREGSQWRFTNS